MEGTEAALAVKIISSFFVGMLIILATAVIIGPERKAKWFRKRQKYSFFNRRGFVGDIVHFGYPRTMEGLVVALLMFATIGLVGYVIIFVF